jgi:hypothetical protein
MKLVTNIMQSEAIHICTFYAPPSKVVYQHGGRTNFVVGNDIV